MAMERMLTYFRRYLELSTEAVLFLEQHAVVHRYKKNSLYKMADERKPYFCFVLEGLVAKSASKVDGNSYIVQVFPAMSYFMGTQSIFSTEADNLTIQFLQDSSIFEIRNTFFHEALLRFSDITKIFQHLQEKRIERLQQLLLILHLPPVQRIDACIHLQARIFYALTVHQRCSYLKLSNHRDYYEAMNYHRRQK